MCAGASIPSDVPSAGVACLRANVCASIPPDVPGAGVCVHVCVPVCACTCVRVRAYIRLFQLPFLLHELSDEVDVVELRRRRLPFQ